MKADKDVGCKPFKNHHLEQLRLVRSFDWLDLEKLNDIEDVIKETFAQDDAEEYIDEYRVRSIVNSVKRRIQNLEQIIKERQTKFFEQVGASTEDDVAENIAEDYSPKMVL